MVAASSRRPWLAAVLPILALRGLPAAASELGPGWQETTNDQGKVVQQLKIEAPAITEEDQYGPVMPERYRCDACKAVMFHLDAELRKKQPKSRRLKQWEYTDVFDATCRTGFEGYGIRLIDGENALSGPGLPREDKLAPGSGAIQMSSESWSKRLGEVCRKLVFETVGEEDIYEQFYRRFRVENGEAADGGETGLSGDYCLKELRECNVGPKLPGSAKTEEQKKGKAKKDKKKKKDKKAAPKAPKMPGRKVVAAAPTDAEDSARSGAAKVDVTSFLRSLAARHGHREEEYLADRTPAEWEKLLVSIAGKVFSSAGAKEL